MGAEGVDRFGYPNKRPDRRVLVRALRAGRFDLLKAWAHEAQAKFEEDFRWEAWPQDFCSAMSVADEVTQRRTEEWVAHDQDWSALLARGCNRSGAAWAQRGTRFAGETSREQFANMQRYLDATRDDLRAALQANPKLDAAYDELISVAGKGGDRRELQRAQAAAERNCPLCLRWRRSYTVFLKPKWGGAPGAMQRYGDGLEPLLAKNGALHEFSLRPAVDACRQARHAKKFDEAAAHCKRALSGGGFFHAWNAQGELLRAQDRHEEAIGWFDKALAGVWLDSSARSNRAVSRASTGDFSGALEDLELAREIGQDATTKWASKRVGYLIKQELVRLRKAGKMDEVAKLAGAAIKVLPHRQDLNTEHAHAQAERPIEQVVAEHQANPGDYDAALRLDHAHAQRLQFDKVIPVWDAYLQHHPNDGRAYYERAGAYWHLRKPQPAITDMQRACELGNARGCAAAQDMRKRVSQR